MRRLLWIAAPIVMLIAACGGGHDDAGNGHDTGGAGEARTREYVEAVSASMSEDEHRLDQAQADCIGAAIVDLAGVDTLTEADISAEELGDTEDLSSLGVDLPADAVDRLGAWGGNGSRSLGRDGGGGVSPGFWVGGG